MLIRFKNCLAKKEKRGQDCQPQKHMFQNFAPLWVSLCHRLCIIYSYEEIIKYLKWERKKTRDFVYINAVVHLIRSLAFDKRS